ncbi:hypothetical protein KI387_004717, partial [Taxus chinensis]
CRCDTPTSSPYPSFASHPSSSRHHFLHISFNFDSDVAILGSPHSGNPPFAPPAIPPQPLDIPCLFLENADTGTMVVSHVSSPYSPLADDLLGHVKLYLDSLDSKKLEVKEDLLVDDPSIQKVGDNSDSTDRKHHAHSWNMPSKPEASSAETAVADSLRDDRRVDLVSSILNKLQRAFTTLKAWESFTDNSRTAIAKYCFELLALADQLVEDLGSPKAKKAATELKKLI